MTVDPTRVAWTWRHAVCASDLAPTTRHVLLTLSMFMNEMGESCHPSIADICRYSGLDKKTVLKHLAAAREAGWVAVSQHGYRGQKWKRQEYAARWPERDEVAPCPPDEGGGAVPPPSEAEKVVELAPEGGGTEGSKVVDDVHQDKSFQDSSITSPVEREGAGARENGNSEDRKRIERSFDLAWREWPYGSVGSRPEAFKVWRNLTEEARAAARASISRWIAAYRAEGRKYLPALSTYLGEKLWENLPDQVPEPAKPIEGKPWGPHWAGVCHRDLLTVAPIPPPPPPSEFLRRLVDEDSDAGRAERLRRQADYGWPAVKRWHEAAANRRSIAIAPQDVWLANLMEFVPLVSPVFEAWRAEYERRGWPWLPDPGGMKGVFFPAGGPEALDAFEAAIRGTGNDGDRCEAAE